MTTSRRITVRLSPASHQLVARFAEAQGVSIAQYVREATLMRAAWEMGTELGGDSAALAACRLGLDALRDFCLEASG